MLRLATVFRRIAATLAVVLLFAGIVLPVIVPSRVSAGLVTNRSLKLSSSANGNISTTEAGVAVPAGEGGNGAKAKHTITFTMDTNDATIGSMIIMYCTSPILQGACDTPTGLDVNLTSVTVEIDGSAPAEAFSLDTTTENDDLSAISVINNNGHCNVDTATTDRENCIPMKRNTAAQETGKPTITISYGGGASDYIKNPTPDNYSFYARLIIFSDTGYTTQVDYGGLAASTAQQVDILAKVQEILNFSVGVVPTPRVGVACTPFSDPNPSLTLGDTNSVLSTLQAFDNHSYFRINTNTVNGTKVFYSGRTLESGTSDINAMPVNTVPNPDEGTQSIPGSEQFGLAMDQDDIDPGGGGENEGHNFTDMTKSPPYHEGHGTITNLGTAKFAFETDSVTAPKEIASAVGGIACDTGSIRYIANVSTSTPAGIYRTTLTFLALGTY